MFGWLSTLYLAWEHLSVRSLSWTVEPWLIDNTATALLWTLREVGMICRFNASDAPGRGRLHCLQASNGRVDPEWLHYNIGSSLHLPQRCHIGRLHQSCKVRCQLSCLTFAHQDNDGGSLCTLHRVKVFMHDKTDHASGIGAAPGCGSAAVKHQASLAGMLRYSSGLCSSEVLVS